MRTTSGCTGIMLDELAAERPRTGLEKCTMISTNLAIPQFLQADTDPRRCLIQALDGRRVP